MREFEHGRGVLNQFSRCLTDYRYQDEIDHTVEELISQRVCGKKRRGERDKGKALAGKSTLNRLELTPPDATGKDRYKKIVYRGEKIEEYLRRGPNPRFVVTSITREEIDL